MILCLAAEQGYSALCKVSCTIPPFLVGHEGPLQASVISTTWGEAKVVTFKCFVFLTYPICPCNRAWLYKNVQVKLSEPMKLMKMVLISFGVRGGIHRFSWTAINHNDGVKPSILATEFVILTSTFAKWGLGRKESLARRPQMFENKTTNPIGSHRISWGAEILQLKFLFCVCYGRNTPYNALAKRVFLFLHPTTQVSKMSK